MRILALIDVLSFQPAGGAGTVLIEAGRALVRRGHDVHVACRRRTDLPLRGDVQGMHFTTYDASPSMPWTVWTRGKSTTRRAFAEVRPDVVWAHHALPLLWLGDRPAPRVYTFHSPWHEEYLTRRTRRAGLIARGLASLRRRWEGAAIGSSPRVTVLSRAMGERLAEVHGRRDGVEVIPGGADLERFRPPSNRAAARAQLGIAEGALLLATVRSLIPRVGIEPLLDAFAQVRRELPSARLLVGGMGPLRDSLESQAARLGVNDSARFLGFVPDADLTGVLGAADLVVLPSQELEGFGLVAAEALACGTPVVATPVGGLPEVLSPLDPTWIADDRGAEAIARAILRFAAAATPREALSARCRAFAEERFSWDRVATNLERVFAAAREKPL